MRPIRIELEGFLSYRDRTVIDLSDVGAAAILGPNGAGKTSLVEAMAWALYGEGRGRGPDEMVNPESTRAAVKVLFEVGGRTYAVDRERTVGKTPRSALYLTTYEPLGEHENGEVEFGWRDLGHPNIVDTQAAIADLLGMSFATWEATSYIGQGRADAFTRLRPADRKRLLGEVLELDRYGRLSQAAREAGTATRARSDELRRRIGDLDAVLAERDRIEADLETAEDLRESWTSTLKERQETAETAVRAAERAGEGVSRSREALRRLGVARGRLDGLTAESDGLTLELRSLAEVIERREGVSQTLKDAEARLSDISKTAKRLAALRDEAIGKVAAADERQAAIVDRIDRAGRRLSEVRQLGEVCPTCLQPVSAETHERMTAATAEEVADLEAVLEEERADAEDLRQYVAGCDRELADLARQTEATVAEGEEAMEVGRAAERALAREADIAARSEAMAGMIAELREEVGVLEKTPSLDEAEANASEARQIAGAAGRLRDEAATSLREAERAVGSLSEKWRQVQKSEEEVEALGRETEALLGEMEVASLAERAFGRDGIPALLIETAIPEIETEANSILAILTGGRLMVYLQTLGAKKTGGVRETLDVVVGDDVSERPLESLSGGERQMVDLALRIGLARLLAARAGRPIETLVVDEAFTELDEAHRQRTIEAFAGLVRAFPTMLVVTHLADLAEAFGTRFLVERSGGSSTVRREG